MGCCAQGQMHSQSQLIFNLSGYKSERNCAMVSKNYLVHDDGAVCGGQFNRIGNYHKALGNDYFLRNDYNNAIKEFTKAIDYCPEVSIYYSNRALCYKATGEWRKMLADSRQAIYLDPENLKALYTKATALIELEKREETKYEYLEEAIKDLELGYKLIAKKEGENMEFLLKEVDIKLKRARKIHAIKKSAIAKPENKKTEDFVKSLLAKNENSQKKGEDYLKIFEDIMDDNKRENIEVPDYLNCKISYEVLKEPRITPDGLSYEKLMLEEHFTRVGFFDPITRKEIDASKTLPNLNLKKGVDHFYLQHPELFEPEKKNILEIEI